jgi:hypothetical protein
VESDEVEGLAYFGQPFLGPFLNIERTKSLIDLEPVKIVCLSITDCSKKPLYIDRGLRRAQLR